MLPLKCIIVYFAASIPSYHKHRNFLWKSIRHVHNTLYQKIIKIMAGTKTQVSCSNIFLPFATTYLLSTFEFVAENMENVLTHLGPHNIARKHKKFATQNKVVQ
jgi:hypothetical protein